jgi:hypothetical protein
MHVWVYSLYLRRGRAAGGGGGGWALDAGSRAAGVRHNGHGKRRSYRHSSSSFFAHAAVVNCELTEAKAQRVGSGNAQNSHPLPTPQKTKKIKKGGQRRSCSGPVAFVATKAKDMEIREYLVCAFFFPPFF